MQIDISNNDLISEFVTNNSEQEIIDFISELADYASGYFPEFQTEVIKRIEADK